MKNKEIAITNPFLTEGYAGEAWFCDREKETQDIVEAIRNGNNVTLYSPRRMGKTGLIKHAQARLSSDGIRCVYLDIMDTWCLAEFINKLASAVIRSLDSRLELFIRNAIKAFGAMKPSFSVDPITGAPSMSLDINAGQGERTIKDIFDYLNKKNEPCCIAIDEFQQIREYPEKGVEALLRSYIQFTPTTHFIFSGSRRHLMLDMFCNPSKPFYESTTPMFLKEIDKEKYYSFAAKHFSNSGRHLDKPAFDKIYESVNGHTWYVQKWLNKLYSRAGKDVGEEDVDAALAVILRQENDSFSSIMHNLKLGERKLIKAIAQCGVVVQPQSASFLGRYELGAASTVKYSLARLVDKELVYEINGEYSIYNRFFAIWLKSV